MDFRWTEEHKRLQKTVRDFAQNELAPRMDELIHNPDFIPMDLYKRCGELGFWSPLVPKELGGTELGVTGATIIHEELSKVAPTMGLIAMCVMTTAPSILDSKAATEKYLAGIMNGDLVANGGVTDPRGHTNVTEWTPVSKRDGDYFILNGSSLYNTLNTAFDVHMIYGLDEDRNMKIWVVEDGMEGLDHSVSEDKFGMKGSGGGTCTYKNVRVHKDMMYNSGVGDTKTYYTLYTVCPMIGLGAAEGLYEKTLEFAKTHQKDGKPLTDMPYIRAKLAKMNTQMTACRTFIYKSCELLDDPNADDLEARMVSQMCKAYVPDITMEICEECLKILGLQGYADGMYYHYVADTLAAGIMDLPTDYQYEGIAGLMGLKS